MSETVPEEVRERLVAEPVVAHLATCHDGKPHVAPLWFTYFPADEGDADHAGDYVEVMTTGRKLANLRRNDRVALSVQRDEGGHPTWRAVIRGRATVIEDDAENRAANRRINEKYGADDPDAWLAENTLVRVDVGSVDAETF